MRVYRCYRCDFGHHWEVEREKDEPERADDTRCSEGHEAVTCNEEEPADEVQIVLRPAARIVDKVKGQRGLEGRYWLVLLNRSGEEIRKSSHHYSWDEAVNLGKLFRGKDVSKALEWWTKKFP